MLLNQPLEAVAQQIGLRWQIKIFSFFKIQNDLFSPRFQEVIHLLLLSQVLPMLQLTILDIVVVSLTQLMHKPHKRLFAVSINFSGT